MAGMVSPTARPRNGTPHPSRREAQRLGALHATGLLDSRGEDAFDDLVRLACQVTGAPVAALCLVDESRQWCKAHVGMATREVPRESSLCAIAIENPEQMLEIGDITADPRLGMRPRDADGRLLRFYAGVPLLDWKGHALGALCVQDHAPRELDEGQRSGLRALTRQAQRLLELRRLTQRQREMVRQRTDHVQRLEDQREAWQRRHQDLKRQANRDPLTGLLNRRAMERLRVDRKALRRLEAAGYSMALFDVDHFKQINDRHGHLLGDQALRLVARAVLACVREGDLAFRYGGEEFLLLLPATPLAGAFELAERIRLSVAALALPFPLGVSAGVATACIGEDTLERVFERADQALYQAKAGGRNRCMADDDLRS
jgi:diguanylate cyclase (GGDEF)-like protein